MDLELARYCNRLGSGYIDPMTELLCNVAFMLALLALIFGLVLKLDRERGRHIALVLVIALSVHLFVNEVLLKHLLVGLYPMRIRPYLAYPGDIRCVGYPFADSSFPSSHAASTATLATVVGYYFRWALPLGVLFALSMAFSRVHNGMHYPTDVLSGSLFGVTYGFVAIFGFSAWKRRAASRVEQ